MKLPDRLPAVLALVAVLLVSTAIPPATALTPADYAKDYSDPASDVMKLYASNETPVLVNGAFVMSPFPSEVNILRLKSSLAPGNASVVVRMGVKGDVVSDANTSYVARLYTRADNASHYILSYTGGELWLRSNATGFTPVNLTGNETVSEILPSVLEMTVNLTLLGTVTAWNLDATAQTRSGEFLYRDFGWQVPGNPGSGPANPSGTPSFVESNWWWIVLLALVAAGLLIAFLVLKRRRPR